MATHETPCVLCGEIAYCSSDTHALGVGNGGCYEPGPKIEFCSEACFRELFARMKDRWGIYSAIAKLQGREKPFPLTSRSGPLCCVRCDEEQQPNKLRRFVVCKECGNERCPKATDHRLACTRSNARGQPGSRY